MKTHWTPSTKYIFLWSLHSCANRRLRDMLTPAIYLTQLALTRELPVKRLHPMLGTQIRGVACRVYWLSSLFRKPYCIYLSTICVTIWVGKLGNKHRCMWKVIAILWKERESNLEKQYSWMQRENPLVMCGIHV